MWVVGMLVLMFSVVFPTLKILTLGCCLGHPEWLRKNRILRFFALESSKWSMADVMALAIFMSYVAFNGVISSAMNNLQAPGAQLVIPTDSSKILPGFYLFIGFVLASLFLSWKLERTLQSTAAESAPVHDFLRRAFAIPVDCDRSCESRPQRGQRRGDSAGGSTVTAGAAHPCVDRGRGLRGDSPGGDSRSWRAGCSTWSF